MDALKRLEKYVSMPSGTYDIEDVTALAEEIGRDLEALGLEVVLHREGGMGPVIEGTYGHGPEKIMLIGHMDTIFPRADYVPFSIEGNIAHGSGVIDMKGGIVVMECALEDAIPVIDPDKYTIKVIINPDEEIGSPVSHELLFNTAKGAKACLSFEPTRPGGGLLFERKGVTSFKVTCTGVRGHAGMVYKECHSAIQELCERINALYTLRDDSRDISINVGKISGGIAENVVCDYAVANCEYRYFDMDYRAEIMEKIKEICARPGVEGTTTTVEFGASHPSSKETPECLALFEMAKGYAAELGHDLYYERTGGAGDISIAAWAGAPVLDGFGLYGTGAHTRNECAYLDYIPFAVELAKKMLRGVTK